ncbi:hypothetical protein N9L92_04855 [Saprospiraceae bacterium]|nr:hypothetical protein [Saprospiraceae bacterium]
MQKNKIIQLYIKELSEGNTQNIIGLFSNDAKVISPVYGTMNAKDFYTKLSEDTSSSEIKLKQIYQSVSDTKDDSEWAAYFNYKWTLSEGTLVTFDVVDIFTFNPENLITELRIIYDASVSKPYVNKE